MFNINNRGEKNLNRLHTILRKVMKSHRRYAHNKFLNVGLSEGKPKILDFLFYNPGCSQRELAKRCKIEPATVTSILVGMEKEELIYRERNPKDKRILNVYLTNKGREAQKIVDKIFIDLDNKCFEGFSSEEIDQTMYLLNKIYKNIEKGEECSD